MKKRILFLILLLVCFASSFTFAATKNVDLNNIKTEDLRLEKGQNTSLILAPGSPFSIRLFEGATVEFDVDGSTQKAIFEKIGDEAVIKYTLDAGKTYKEQKIKLGDSVRWNVTTGSLFVFLNYKIFHDRDALTDKNAVFEIGIPLLQRYDVPVKVNGTLKTEDKKQNIEVPATKNGYLKYLMGVIIVLILIIIILGPRRKEDNKPPVEEKRDTGKKTALKSANKTYYTKPKKKPFNEEDVYVVNHSEDEE